MSLLGSRAPDALTMCRRYLERAVARGRRRLGPAARRWPRSTSATTRPTGGRASASSRSTTGSSATAPVSAICLYDRRRLPAAVVDSAAATHPQLVRGTDLVGQRRLPGPGRLRALAARCRGPPSRTATRSSPSTNAPTLAGLRHQLGAVLATLVPDREQQEDLHLAASEIAANAFRHGVRPVSARVWADGDLVVCVISDRGTSYSDPFSGFVPAHGLDLSHGGMGLWLARKLWDHVDVLPTAERAVASGSSTRLR